MSLRKTGKSPFEIAISIDGHHHRFGGSTKSTGYPLNEAMIRAVIPPAMARLPISAKGFPVPWFVAWLDDAGKIAAPGTGTPDFRVVDQPKIEIAYRQRRCWLCGGFMGTRMAFTIGPMCAINRVTSEPGAHRDCAIFAATACPFLSNPRMRRNEKNLPEQGAEPSGVGIARNPGAVAVWITREVKPFNVTFGQPGVLFRIGLPETVLWFAEGRTATRAEVIASIDSGMPELEKIAIGQGHGAIAELQAARRAAMNWLPA